MCMNTESKYKLRFAGFLIIVGAGLLVAGFCVPPPGEIPYSLLVAFGEILTFAGTVFGINYHYRHNHNNNNQQP